MTAGARGETIFDVTGRNDGKTGGSGADISILDGILPYPMSVRPARMRR